MEIELYHAGVRGMKWGIRNDKKKSSGGRKTRSSSKTEKVSVTLTKKPSEKKKKLKYKTDRGAKVVAKASDKKVKIVISNATAIAAGTLRVAASFIPGASVLTGAANVAALVGTAATLKK